MVTGLAETPLLAICGKRCFSIRLRYAVPIKLVLSDIDISLVVYTLLQLSLLRQPAAGRLITATYAGQRVRGGSDMQDFQQIS
jgi:hypothetical protein